MRYDYEQDIAFDENNIQVESKEILNNIKVLCDNYIERMGNE